MLMGDRQEQGDKEPEHLWFLVVSFFGRPHVSFAVSLCFLSISPSVILSNSVPASFLFCLCPCLPGCLSHSLSLWVPGA